MQSSKPVASFFKLAGIGVGIDEFQIRSASGEGVADGIYLQTLLVLHKRWVLQFWGQWHGTTLIFGQLDLCFHEVEIGRIAAAAEDESRQRHYDQGFEEPLHGE